jgi:hypothetical protein
MAMLLGEMVFHEHQMKEWNVNELLNILGSNPLVATLDILGEWLTSGLQHRLRKFKSSGYLNKINFKSLVFK